MNEVSKFIINNEEIEVKDAGARASISNLSEVARTGEYDDLLNKPTIPPAITIDSELSITSENPVQNKVITSNINNINDNINVIGPYTNLFKPTLQSTTQSGISCENNGDGTYTLNGTATANAWIGVGSVFIPQIDCYILGSNNDNIGIYINGQTSTAYNTIRTVSNADKGLTKTIGITVKSGTTLSNVIVKPMLTSNIFSTYNKFTSYTGSTGKLNSDIAELQKNTKGLKFNVNGTNLEITDGTHTWTITS